MKKLRIELVEDWREAHKWSSMRLSAFLAALYLALPHLLALLAHLLPLLSDHWLEVAPWVMHFFPTASQSVVPVIGLLLMMGCRITKIRVGGEQ